MARRRRLSMIAAMLDAGGVDPTVINGGIINNYGSNARLGDSDWMVVEADESDGSFLRLDGTIAVVTNIDPEHLDHYGGFDAVKEAFVEFIENVPFYGVAILCLDHPEVQAIIPRIRDRRIMTYGFSAQADVRGENVDADSRRQPLRRGRARRAMGRCARSRASSCRCRAGTMSRTRWPPSPSPWKWAWATLQLQTGFAKLWRRQAALHQGRRSGRRDHHRRLWPPSGRNPRGAVGGARRGKGPSDRGLPAAPLLAAWQV